MGVPADIANFGDINRLYDAVQQAHAQIDVVFANAHGSSFVFLAAMTQEQFDDTFGINAKGTAVTVQKVSPLLKEAAAVLTNFPISTKDTTASSICSAAKAAVCDLERFPVG